MARRHMLILACLVLGTVVRGQDPFASDANPVRITSATTVETVPVGEVFLVEVAVAITPPYHIYGMGEIDTGVPTSFRVVDPTGAFARAGEPVAAPPPALHEGEYGSYDYWEGKVTFKVPVKATGTRVGELGFKLAMDHMACTMEACLPPGEVAADVKVTVEGEATGGGVDPGGEATERETEDEGEAVEPPALAGEARLEPARVKPGQEALLLIPVKGGTWEPEDTLPREQVILASPGLIVTGEGTLVAVGEGLMLRVPVIIAEGDVEEGTLAFSGVVQTDEGSFAFTGKAEVARAILGFLLFAAVAALLALLTPCVFPMIPITISVFTKQQDDGQSPVLKALVYCLGIVVTFTAFGALLTLIFGGAGASTFAQHWITNLFIGVLFIVFALSLFGMFELRLPAALTALTGKAQGQGGMTGILLLGLLFAVTTFTCTAPFVGTILAAAATSGEWARPILGMVVFAGVLAFPFFFLALFPSRMQSLPRAGAWMNQVKVCMGFIELAAAFKFLAGMDQALRIGVVTRSFVLCAWAVIFVVMGIYLLRLFRLPHDAPPAPVGVIPLCIALISLGFGLYLTRGLNGAPLHSFVDAFLGRNTDQQTTYGQVEQIGSRLKRLEEGGMRMGGAAPRTGRLGIDAQFVNDYEAARAEAIRLGAPLFINFTGHT